MMMMICAIKNIYRGINYNLLRREIASGLVRSFYYRGRSGKPTRVINKSNPTFVIGDPMKEV